MNSEIRILVVDDQRLVRESVVDRLHQEEGFNVVAHLPCANDVRQKTLELRPDVILMDIEMEGQSAFEATREVLRLDAHRPSVIFVTGYTNDTYISEALSIEASGYVTKTESQQQLVKAIRQVAEGGSWYSEEVQDRIVVDERGKTTLATTRNVRLDSLTVRELETLRHIARGKTKKEIATLMCISPKTVDHHTSHLMDKLDIHNRVELARFAIREGLISA